MFNFGLKLCNLFPCLCLVLSLLSHSNCEKQYDLKCNDQNCSKIISEGHLQQFHPGDDDLIELRPPIYLFFYGENKEFYLTQSKNIQGLVKKISVRIEKKYAVPQIKIRARFKNKKLILIDSDGDKLNKTSYKVSNSLNSSLKEDTENEEQHRPSYKETINESNETTILTDASSNNVLAGKQQQVNLPKIDNYSMPQVNNNLPQKIASTLVDQVDASPELNDLTFSKDPSLNRAPIEKQANILSQENLLIQPANKDPLENLFTTESLSPVDNLALNPQNASPNSNDSNYLNDLISNEVINEKRQQAQLPIFNYPKVPLANSNLPQEKNLLGQPAKKVLLENVTIEVLSSIDKLDLQDASPELNDSNDTSSNEVVTEKPQDFPQENLFSQPANKVSLENLYTTETLPPIDKPNLAPADETDNLSDQQHDSLSSNSGLPDEKAADEASVDNESSQLTRNHDQRDELLFKSNPLPGSIHIEIPKNYGQALTTEEMITVEPQIESTAHLKKAKIQNTNIKNRASNRDEESLVTVESSNESEKDVAKKVFDSGDSLMRDAMSPEDKQEIDELSFRSNPVPGSIHIEIPKNYGRALTDEEILTDEPQIESTAHLKKAKIQNTNIKNRASNQDVESLVTAESSNESEEDVAKEVSDAGDSLTQDAISPEDNEQESFQNSPADQEKTTHDQPTWLPSSYIMVLSSALGRIVEIFPESFVLFLEHSLLISAKLLTFLFLIGLLWIVIFYVKLLHISNSNETSLKNNLCETQSKMFLMQRECDDLRSKLNSQHLKLTQGLEEQRHEVEKQVKKLNVENNQLKESKLSDERELEDQRIILKSLEKRIEQLNEANDILSEQNTHLREALTEEEIENELSKKNLDELDEINKDLIAKNKEIEQQAEEYKIQIVDLRKNLEEQFKLTSEKEIEIGCLNKMLDELKESKKLINDLKGNSDESDSADHEMLHATENSTANFYDIVKLRCEIEKLEKERNDAKEKLSAGLEKIGVLESKLARLEQESSQYNETKSKVMKEKEEAEKYLDFLKKYYNENKNDLQKELGVYQYKEKQLADENKELRTKIEIYKEKFEEYEQKYQTSKNEFEDVEKQLRDELLTCNKSACDYFKSAQALKAELASVKKDAEYLRQQLRNPASTNSGQSKTATTKILPPPEIPKSILDLIGQLSTGQMAAGLPNLNNLNNIANFITAPSPIPPQSLGYDYQQAANYQGSFSTLPFTPQSAQPATSMYNNVPTSNSFQQIFDPMMLNPASSAANVTDAFAGDYHTSLPNIPYSNNQSIDTRFNPTMLNNQHWDPRNTSYTPSNETMNEGNTSNSPHPSIHNI